MSHPLGSVKGGGGGGGMPSAKQRPGPKDLRNWARDCAFRRPRPPLRGGEVGMGQATGGGGLDGDSAACSREPKPGLAQDLK